MEKGDLVRIKDVPQQTLFEEGRSMGVILGFDVYNGPREMRQSRMTFGYPPYGSPRKGEIIVKVLWSGSERAGWVLKDRLEVVDKSGMQT